MTAITHKRILIAEDHPDIASFLAMALEAEGYAVDLAPHGLEAMRRAREQRPDAILLDLMMPIVDGWQVLKECRVDPRLAGIPILVLSASYDSLRDAALDSVVVLPKPIEVDVLLARLQEAVTKRDLAQSA